jgi:hypothetical protein
MVEVLGMSIPFELLLMSRIAFGSGMDPSLLMATFCAMDIAGKNRVSIKIK